MELAADRYLLAGYAVMLRSLPVSDPPQLYRIGDGDHCCVQGGPQDRWGMFSYPLFERLKAEAPEFEELTAYQAGAARLSVRRLSIDTVPRPLRSFQSHFVRGLRLVTSIPVGTLEPQVKRALAEADPNLTVTTVRTLGQQVERSFDQQRAVASLAGLFGGVALILAAE